MINTSKAWHYECRNYKKVPHGRPNMWIMGRCLCYRVSTRPKLMKMVPRLFYGHKLGERVKRPTYIYPTWHILPNCDLPF